MEKATSRESSGSDGAVIELDGVYKRFGRQIVLDEVSLRIRGGETNVVIGSSGTGKSVLLKHIVGLLRPDRGRVFFQGQRIDNLSEKHLAKVRRNFGFLFQLSALFDSMTAGDNVGFPLTQQTGKSASEIRRIVQDKLHMVGLDGIQDKMPAELSGGQKKRVALARALSLDPAVILYDEPTTGLDPIRADVINELISKLRRELNVTSVIVTHDMASVYKVADRVVMLYGGKFIFDGTCDQIRRCEDDRVRRFIEGRATHHDLAGLEERE